MQDFMAALKEVKPAFGAVVETLDSYRLNGITNWGPGFEHLAATCRTLVEQAGSRARLARSTLPKPRPLQMHTGWEVASRGRLSLDPHTA